MFTAGNRALLLDALSPPGSVGDGIAKGEGAIYLWARLPADCGVWLLLLLQDLTRYLHSTYVSGVGFVYHQGFRV